MNSGGVGLNLFVRLQTSLLWTAASRGAEDDNRIRVLIENGVQTKHRSLFVVVGNKGRGQVSKTRCVRMFSSLAEFADQTASSTCWNPIAVHCDNSRLSERETQCELTVLRKDAAKRCCTE